MKDASNEISKLNGTVREQNKTINNLNKQLKDANNKITKLNTTVNDLNNQLDKSNKQIKSLNNAVNKLTKELKDAYKKIDNLINEINKLTNKTKLNTTITINPIKSSVGSVVKLYANIIDERGLPVKDGRVIFKINGKTLKDENNNVIYAIVSNGTASISYKVQNVWLKNTTTIQAVYGGSQKYASSRTNSSDVLNISKGIATISLEKSSITAKVGQTITLRAKVVDGNGDRINSSKVAFKLNGKSLRDNDGNILYAKVVDGEAVLDYTLPNTYTAKTHNITVIFSDG